MKKKKKKKIMMMKKKKYLKDLKILNFSLKIISINIKLYIKIKYIHFKVYLILEKLILKK